MKLKIDWTGMLKAAMKAVWPFIAGAVGGGGLGNTAPKGSKGSEDLRLRNMVPKARANAL